MFSFGFDGINLYRSNFGSWLTVCCNDILIYVIICKIYTLFWGKTEKVENM